MSRLLLCLLPVVVFAAPSLAAQGRPPAGLGRAPFLWGVAMSGFQNDGSTPSMDWHALEAAGRVPESSLLGPSFRRHMEGDLDRAKGLGLTAFRTSIEWARLEPKPGQWDAAEVAYVHRLLKGIRSRGMTPVITLHHFTTPAWVYARTGDVTGWEDPRMVEAYWRYVEFVAKEFGSEIDWYITINEPSTLLAGGYLVGWIAPHRTGPLPVARAIQGIVRAHVGAYERLHKLDAGCKVSLAEYNSFMPIGDTGLSYMPGQLLDILLEKTPGWDGRPRVKHLDYMALHYYGSVDLATASAFPVQPWRWGVRPDHFEATLKAYYETFRLPIMVAENGFATKDEDARADGWTRESYMVAHVQAMGRVRRAGVPIIGYMYWTLTDNYEWGSYSPRFGLWSVDSRAGDLTRRPRPVVEVYRDIIRHGEVTPELAQRFPGPPAPQAAWF